METVRFRGDNLSALKSNKRFLLGLQLARLYNSLNASQRIYLSVPFDENPANQRDRIERMLYHGAIIAESIVTLRKNYTALSELPSWNNEIPEVAFVKTEMTDEHSFSSTILKTIRDKIAYHYDVDVINTILKDYELYDGIRFGQAQSTSGIDLCFPMIDEMILTFVLEKYKPNDPDTSAFDEFSDKLANASNSLSKTLMELTTDLLAAYMSWE